jgi:hypothetical protein
MIRRKGKIAALLKKETKYCRSVAAGKGAIIAFSGRF